MKIVFFPPTAIRLTMAALSVSVSSTLHAANQTWSSDGSSANWSSASNWGGNAAPGAVSGTTSTDIATFGSAVGAVGTVGNPVVIDGYLNIKGFLFSGAPGSFTIGSAGGNPLYLSEGGTIQTSSGNTNSTLSTQTFAGPLALAGINLGGYTFRDDSPYNGVGAGKLIIAGPVSVSSSVATYNLNLRGTGVRSEVTGVISNGNASKLNLFKIDSGTWTLSGMNTFTGDFGITQGILIVNSIAAAGSASALGAGNNVLFGRNAASANEGRLQFTGASGGTSDRALQIVGYASGSGGGGVIENTVAGQTLTLTGNVTATGAAPNLTLTGAGNGVLGGNVVGSPAMSLLKSGNGTWIVSGTNTYTGTTTVSAGTLLINGDNSSATGAVSVTGGTFGGNGTVGGGTALASGAKLSAGSAIGMTGTLTFRNGLDLSAASNNTSSLLFDLMSTSNSDKVILTGGTLNIGTLDGSDFSFTIGAGFGAGSYVLFDASSAIIGSIGSGSVDFGGGLTGTLSIDAVNNDIILQVVPEPNSAALVLSFMGLAFCILRRRPASIRNEANIH